MKKENDKYKYVLSFGHLCADINSGSLASILPFLIAARGYNYETAASLVFFSNIVASIVQPFFGSFADKKNMPKTMVAAVILSAGGMGLTGIVESFPALAVCVMISGLGNALFHPQAARLINLISEKGKTGKGISIFSFGGNLGFALGPALITLFLTVFGLKGTGILFVPALVSSVILYRNSKNFTDEALKKGNYDGVKIVTEKAGVDTWKGFLLLALFITTRSIIMTGLNTYIPLYSVDVLGMNEVQGNLSLTLYYSVSTITTLFGGMVADRLGYVRSVRIFTIFLAVFSIWYVFARNGLLCTLLLIPVGAFMNLTYSPMVVLGQKYLPNHLGLASGLTLGLTTSLGGVFMPVLGRIGDTYGLDVAMYVCGLFCVVPALLGFTLPQPQTAEIKSA